MGQLVGNGLAQPVAPPSKELKLPWMAGQLNAPSFGKGKGAGLIQLSIHHNMKGEGGRFLQQLLIPLKELLGVTANAQGHSAPIDSQRIVHRAG